MESPLGSGPSRSTARSSHGPSGNFFRTMKLRCRWLANCLTLMTRRYVFFRVPVHLWPPHPSPTSFFCFHHSLMTLMHNVHYVFTEFLSNHNPISRRTSLPRQVSSPLSVLWAVFGHFSHLSVLMHSLTAVNSGSTAAASSISRAVITFGTDFFMINRCSFSIISTRTTSTFHKT